MGVDSVNGPLPKLAAIAAVDKPPPDTSWRVEVIGAKGQRWRNGVSFSSKAEAQTYGTVHAREEVPDYRTAEILSCPEAAAANR